MKTMLMLTAFAGAVALSACAPNQESAPGVEPTPVACKASDYQEYVGRNRSTIPADAPRGRIFRVLCSSCAATMDYRENRVTFTYDDQTNVVTRVSCG
ncbi:MULTISPECIES: hemolysin [unclassified Brevundimonas]|uniref:hemolysin n=1 Tax=unclassified Brevundimonas TaxID=2622653 RepID=UPI000CFD71FD|nr:MULTISPECIES: hemolysin [unclassified Brevundimonas]PRA32666.1 hemolysin [Brevundimonas sp. MYb27]PQZ80592.1 hemolysin [Brevundimonas sp. MYb31]PRB16875.1 hemolysin [Brevundimonas sp. MYb52]PRB37410.1 hemolysin [Brevundimonas sp. MYb46]PRB54913.1 hemolysin [Brevundimonas sp. MYb33]